MKMDMSVDDMVGLLEISKERGTVDVWCKIAIEWMQAATRSYIELQNKYNELLEKK